MGVTRFPDSSESRCSRGDVVVVGHFLVLPGTGKTGGFGLEEEYRLR